MSYGIAPWMVEHCNMDLMNLHKIWIDKYPIWISKWMYIVEQYIIIYTYNIYTYIICKYGISYIYNIHSLGKLYHVTQRASQPTTALYIIFHQHKFLEINGFTFQTTFWCDIVWHRWKFPRVIRAPVLPSFLAWRMVQHISAGGKGQDWSPNSNPKAGSAHPPRTIIALGHIWATLHFQKRIRSIIKGSFKPTAEHKGEGHVKKMRVNSFLCRCIRNKYAKCGIYLNKYVSINTQIHKLYH